MRDRPKRAAQGSLMIALAASGWGTWPFFLHQIEKGGNVPASLEATIAMLGLTLASGTLVIRDRLPVRARLRDWAEVGLLAVTDALNIIFLFSAYQRTSVAIAVLTHYLTPMLVAVAAPLLGLEAWRRRTFVAVLVSLTGLVLLLSPWSAERHAGDVVGALFGLASAVCYAVNVLVSKRLVPVFSGSEMSFYHSALSVGFLALVVPGHAWVDISGRSMSWLAVGALLPGAMCGLVFVWGLRRVRASHASNLTLFEPLVATVGASVALHQPLGVSGVVGGVLILVGAIAAATRRGDA